MPTVAPPLVYALTRARTYVTPSMVAEPKNAAVVVATVDPPLLGVKYHADQLLPSTLCSKLTVAENVPVTEAEQTE